jgi:hypothetical protein
MTVDDWQSAIAVIEHAHGHPRSKLRHAPALSFSRSFSRWQEFPYGWAQPPGDGGAGLHFPGEGLDVSAADREQGRDRLRLAQGPAYCRRLPLFLVFALCIVGYSAVAGISGELSGGCQSMDWISGKRIEAAPAIRNRPRDHVRGMWLSPVRSGSG